MRANSPAAPMARTLCFGTIFRLFTVVSIAVSLADAKPPLAGGAGYAMYFDHERSDIMSWTWTEPPRSAMTIEYWVYFYDHHLGRNHILDYDVYSLVDGLEFPEPYALILSRDYASPRLYAGSFAVVCEAPECDTTTPQHKDSWHHFAIRFDFSSGEIAWFVNGTKVQETISSDLKPFTANGIMSLGQGSTGLLRDFYGGDVIIDQVRIWSSKLSAEAIREAYNNAGLDPALYQDLDAQLSFDKLIDVKGKLYAEDDSGNENDASYGHWPAMKQSLMTATHGIQPISKPRMVGSRADLYGKDIVIYVHPGEEVEFTLRGKGPTGDNLITTIVSVPKSDFSANGGLLASLDNIELAIGAVVSTASVESEGLAPRVRYTAPSSMQADEDTEWAAHFVYSVTNTQGETAEATVILRDHSAFGPPDKVYFTPEDTPVGVLLGSIDMNGSPLSPLVTSLPSEGHLFQAVFGPGALYGSEDFSNLTAPFREEELPILVSDSRGVVFYVPPKDMAISGSPLASFTYVWKFKSDLVSVEAAFQITLQQTDVDPTFATRPYFRVSTWPGLGSLLQEDGALMEEKEAVPIILQYVEDIPPFHEPTNTPAFSSQFSMCGPCCYTQENCTMLEAECGADCLTFSWHVSNMIGPPAVFPSTEDSILGWDFICDICSEKQYGVFKFADPVYINSATLFEINAGGSLYKFSASSSWEGSDTKWTTLWEGEAGPLPENAARAFTPPLCPEVQEKFQYVRLDFDPAAVPGWNNHDGMSLRGSFEFPPGQVSSSSGVVSYAPLHGFHSSDGTTPLDEFTYVASDCLDEGKEGAPVKMVVRDPAPGTGSLFAAARQTSHYLIGDKVVVDLGVEVAVEALGSSLGTDDYAARMDEIHVQIMAPTNTSMSDFEKFQISSSEDERIDLQGSAMHTISRVSSGGGSGGYRVNIENTDRSLDSITLHMWITFPSKFITFRTEVHLAAKCHDSIEDPAECASTEFDCLGTGSGFISDMKRCFSSCNPGYEPQQAPDTQNGTESVTCTPCPAGAFSNGRGAACVPCSPGFISFAE
ncbi:hypothetical protein CYMTET_43969, partial [Cymbomonas tetramitiformis]